MTTKEDRLLHEPAKQPVRTAEAKPVDHFAAIRGHISELTKSGDQTLKNALGKIIVRLDRIEGKTV